MSGKWAQIKLTNWLSKAPHATCSQAGVHVIVWGWLCQQRAPSLNQTWRKCCLGMSNQPNRLFMAGQPCPAPPSPSPPPSCSAMLNVPAGFTCWINTTHWAANPTSRKDGKAGALTLHRKGLEHWGPVEPQGLSPVALTCWSISSAALSFTWCPSRHTSRSRIFSPWASTWSVRTLTWWGK